MGIISDWPVLPTESWPYAFIVESNKIEHNGSRKEFWIELKTGFKKTITTESMDLESTKLHNENGL